MFDNPTITTANKTTGEEVHNDVEATNNPIDKELILTLCFCSVLAIFLVILGLCFKPKVITITI